MIKDKNRIYEIILSILVFIYLVFHIGVFTILCADFLQIYFEIYIFLLLLDLFLSAFLSYKFYKLLGFKPLGIIKSFILSDFVILVLYFFTLMLFILITQYLMSSNQSKSILTSILGIILLIVTFEMPLIVGYFFYKSIYDSKSLNDFQIKRDKFFEVEKKISFGPSGGDYFNCILVTIISFILYFLINFVMIGFSIDFNLLLQCGFVEFLYLIIFTRIFKNYEFITSLFALAFIVLLILLSLGALGFILNFEVIIVIFLLFGIPSLFYLILILIENKIFSN